MKFSRIGVVDIDAIEKYFAFSMNVSLMLAVLFLQFLIGGVAIAAVSADQVMIHQQKQTDTSEKANAATDQLNVEPQLRKDLISRKVRVGLYENKPKIYTGEAGVASGIFPDILEEIARKEKWQLSYVPCEWVGCLDALEKRRIDLMPDVAFTPDRNDQFDFHTEEVVGSWSAVYAKNRKQMSKIADLNGRRIAVLEGSIQQTILEEMVEGFGFQVTFIEAKSFEEAYSLMANGAADAVVSNRFFGDYFHQQYGLEKTPIVFNPVSLYFATASGANPDLLKAIDYHLRVMKSEPGSVYYKALVRWMEEPTVVIVPPYLIWIIGGVGGLLVLAFMFILLFRWQVRVGTRHLAQANEMLRDSEKMFRDLFHQHAAVKLLIDPDTGKIVEANEAAENFYGWSREQLRRMRIQDINTLSPEQVKAEMEKAKNLQRVHFEFCHRLANGSVKDVAVFSSKIDIQGKPLLHSIIHDITERKEAEEAQRKSQQLFSTLFRVNPGATILSLQADGKCVDANEAYAKLTGYTRKELIGKTTVELNIWISAEERQRVVTELAHKGNLENVELTLRRKNGEIINTIASGEVISLDGQLYILSFFFDITERKRAEEKRQRLEERLRRAEKMEALGTLSGGVAHDLNNVLGVLVGYSELLLMEMGEANPLRSHVSSILQASQNAAAIIQDLLTLARRGVSVSKVVNLNDVISRQLKTLEYEMLKKCHPTVTFKRKLEKDLLNVKGSPIHLEKTVMNLLSNAAEAITDQGEVTIVTENRYLDKPITGYDHIQEGDYVVLRVSDNGRGISAADIGKIFEPFYTKKVMGRSGTGLGLAVVWGTVKDHRGYIDVQSEEGKGSTFVLYFPVTRDERVSDQRGILAEFYMGRGESILVVDDVEEQRKLATTMLSRLGYRVSSVSSGEEAVIYLNTNRVDLLVLDMIMDPGMDGLETYQKALEINPRQKAIIMSGFSETDRVKKAQELGAGAYVQKPYIQEKIGLAIRKELDK